MDDKDFYTVNNKGNTLFQKHFFLCYWLLKIVAKPLQIRYTAT